MSVSRKQTFDVGRKCLCLVTLVFNVSMYEILFIKPCLPVFVYGVSLKD